MDRKKYLASLYSEEDKKLIRFFQQELKRINLLYIRAVNAKNGDKAKQLIGKLNEIEKILYNEYSERAEQAIPKEYLKGMTYINDVIAGGENLSYILGASNKEINKIIASFGPAHTDAVNALLNTSKNYVRSSLDGMTRQALTMINEIQQDKVMEQLAGGMLTGESLQAMEQRIKNYFFENKITVFKDRAGRTWQMDRYVDMLTRTETSIANVQGTINRAIQLGITKFKVIENIDCCEYCAEYNGTVVDVRDGTVDLPPFHPNCRGYIVAVVDGVGENNIDEVREELKNEESIKEKIEEIRAEEKNEDNIENNIDDKIDNLDNNIYDYYNKFPEYPDEDIKEFFDGHSSYINGNGLPVQSAITIDYYTGTGSGFINTWLREPFVEGEDDEGDLRMFEYLKNTLSSAIKNNLNYKDTVYRWEERSIEYIEGLKKDGIYEQQGFLSASKREDLNFKKHAYNGGGLVKYIIRNHNGGMDIKKWSANSGEDEILFNYGKKFKAEYKGKEGLYEIFYLDEI